MHYFVEALPDKKKKKRWRMRAWWLKGERMKSERMKVSSSVGRCVNRSLPAIFDSFWCLWGWIKLFSLSFGEKELLDRIDVLSESGPVTYAILFRHASLSSMLPWKHVENNSGSASPPPPVVVWIVYCSGSTNAAVNSFASTRPNSPRTNFIRRRTSPR